MPNCWSTPPAMFPQFDLATFPLEVRLAKHPAIPFTDIRNKAFHPQAVDQAKGKLGPISGNQFYESKGARKGVIKGFIWLGQPFFKTSRPSSSAI